MISWIPSFQSKENHGILITQGFDPLQVLWHQSNPTFAIDFVRTLCFQYKQQRLNQFKWLTSPILIIIFVFHYVSEMMGVFQQLHEESVSTPGTVDEMRYYCNS